MKRIIMASLLLASLTLTACTGSAGKGTAGDGAPAAAPATKSDPQPAAKPSSIGGTYKGTVQRGYEITFEVSADGKRIKTIAANVLESCTGSSTSRTTQLYWDGPFTVGADGTVLSEGKDPEYPDLQYKFTAKFGADGTASGTVLQKGAGCTTHELQWTARKG